MSSISKTSEIVDSVYFGLKATMNINGLFKKGCQKTNRERQVGAPLKAQKQPVQKTVQKYFKASRILF